MSQMVSSSVNSIIIELYYYTGWNSPTIHYDSGIGGWKQFVLEPTEKYHWFKAAFNDYPQHGIEFVICDGSKTHWDNPSYASIQKKGRNYFLTPSQSDSQVKNRQIPSGVERFTLVNGIITHISGPPILLATDLDGTLLGHDAYLARFNEVWLQRHQWRGSILVYSTGRNLKDFLCAASYMNLLQPDYAICGVGTELYIFGNESSSSNSVTSLIKPLLENLTSTTDNITTILDPLVQDSDIKCPHWCPSRLNATFDPQWLHSMRSEFNRPKVEAIVRSLPGEFHINGNIYHDPWRISVSARLSDVIELCKPRSKDGDMTEALNVGMTTTLGISDAADHVTGFKQLMRIFKGYKLLLSGRGEFRYLDILPFSAGKLAPLEMLMERTGFKPQHTLVCGDSGNDVDMFAHPLVRGVCVSNSQDELKEFLEGKQGLATLRGLKPTPFVFFSTLPCAGGILQALEHFGFDTNVIDISNGM